MSSNFHPLANITSVSFVPRDFIQIDGMLWPPKYREARVVSDNVNVYNLRWFWYSDLPKPVSDILIEAADVATEDLTEQKALPTFWPRGLMAEEQHYPFQMYFEEIKIFNDVWGSEQFSEARLRITSDHHLGPGADTPNVIFSTVKFDEGKELNKRIFEVLEEHL